MNIGIIAEYNPFHNGHFYHIAESKKITGSENCIVIMSGNFVQRGEPAILNKQIRTKAALLNGASIVIELPVPFATGSAEVFAYGAINILNSTNIIDYICFGAETNNIEFMTEIANILINEPLKFKESLSNNLSAGLNYPTARQNALNNYIYNNCNNSILLSKYLEFLKLPNNILALEYIKALKKSNSKIKPIAIKRIKNEFHSKEITSKMASAESIRLAAKNLKNKKFYNNFNNDDNNINKIEEKIKKSIPENFHKLFFKEIKNYPELENYKIILDYILRTKTKEEISNILDITEGLENRISKYISEKTVDDLLSKVKTKRYTLTKLQHAIIHIILDVKKEDIFLYLKGTDIPYIRVLGFRKDKINILRELSEKSSVPVITNIKKAEKSLSPKALYLLKKEMYSSDLYYMFTTKEINSEYTKPIIVI